VQVQLPENVKITNLINGVTFMLAVADDGRVFGWGLNRNGGLGLPNRFRDGSEPVEFPDLRVLNGKVEFTHDQEIDLSLAGRRLK
jgi:alpha-tubulin suppressor-like RCC1 family protein